MLISYKRKLSKEFIAPKKLRDIKKDIVCSYGRGSFEVIFKKIGCIKGDYILLPNILAEGNINPIKNLKLNILHYKMDYLIPNIQDIITLIKSSNRIKAIVVIHYFGIPVSLKDIKVICKENNIVLIEDCAHSFLSKYSNGVLTGSIGDFSINSLEKFLSVSDGSIIRINNERYLNSFNNLAYKGKSLKHISDNLYSLSKQIYPYSIFFSKAVYFIAYKLKCICPKPCRISLKTVAVYEHYNLDLALEVRQKHINIYHNELINFKGVKIIDNLSGLENLTGYPIWTLKAKELQKHLLQKGIETLRYNKRWFFSDIEEKEYFLNIILLPINETISEQEIKQVIEAVNSY